MQYKDEVKSRSYPAEEHTYPMPKEAFEEFRQLVDEEKEKSDLLQERC
jgi:3-methyl-2-oxobutanoate hydroxymethyltransferase